MAAEATDIEGEEPPKKKGKMGLILGVVFLLAGAGGGYGIVAAGLLPGGGDASPAEEKPTLDVDDVAFVPIDPMLIPLGSPAEGRHLRFRAQLEVVPGYESDVAKLMPRIMDILNSYLRAIDIAILEDPGALITVRAQMLRRIQIVIGEDFVTDLLITEFVQS
jgi:flagellar FliL protein